MYVKTYLYIIFNYLKEPGHHGKNIMVNKIKTGNYILIFRHESPLTHWLRNLRAGHKDSIVSIIQN